MKYHLNYLLLSILLVLISKSTVSSIKDADDIITEYGSQPNIPIKLVLAESTDCATSDLQVTQTPVIFWHGMGDTAYGSINTDRLALQKKFPNITVFSVQIGNNMFEDELGGYFLNVNYQINMVCKEILNNQIIKRYGSFNAVGFSQGAQFMRGLIQRCPFQENGIKVKNFISLGGQHQGVFGLPNCFGNIFCDHIRHLLTTAVFETSVQEHVVQAEYWHDPLIEDVYRNKSVFIAEINNENHVNEVYKRNLLSLDNLVLVQFKDDEMVIPRESSSFGFYMPGQAKKVLALEQSDLYREDRLGLRQLKESGRLHFIEIPGKHLQYKMNWFLDDIASVYLQN